MKKRLTVWIILIVLVLVMAGLYITRNRWAGYLLKKEVAAKTGGKVSLSFSSVQLGVFKKQLVVLNPSLSFKNTFFNHDHSLKLKNARFRELSIHDLFLWAFFFQHEYICKEIEVVRPSFQLAAGNTVKNKVTFHPKTWIGIFKDHRLGVFPLKFQIKHAFVRLGRIELGRPKGSGETGGAEYNVSIEDLGNINNRSLPGEISYKNFQINIRNFYRHSKRKNYSLKIDSASYLSSPQEFIVSGLHYHITSKPEDQNLNLNVKRAAVKGLIPDTSAKTLRVVAARWNGGSFTFPEGKLSDLFSGKQPDTNLEEVAKIFAFLKFDTLAVNRVHVFRLAKNNDTVLSVKNFNLHILNARISEKTFSHPLRFMSFGSINTQMKGLYYFNAQNGNKVYAAEVGYGSAKKMITARNLTCEKLCPESEKPLWKFGSKQLNVENFSAERFRKKEKQVISAEADRPDIRIWDNRYCRLPGHASHAFDNLNFKSLNLKNGTFLYFGKHRETVSLTGLELYAGNLRREPDSGRSAFLYDTLWFSAVRGGLSNPANALKMSTGNIQWLRNDLQVENIDLTQNEKSDQRNITIPLAILGSLRLDSLTVKKTLAGGEAFIYRPDVVIRQQDSLNDPDTIPFGKTLLSQLPLKISFSKVLVKKGHLGLTEIHTNDSIRLNTGISVAVQPFKMGYVKKQPVSPPDVWSVVLDHTSYKNRRIDWKADSTVMSSPDSTLNIRNLLLSADRDTTVRDLRYDVRVPLTQVNKMDYAKLFRSDSLVFGKIAFHDADLHVTLPGKLSYSRLLPETRVLFDSLEMDHAAFTINRKIRSSDLKITGRKLDVLYKPMLRSLSPDSLSAKSFLKKWDISLKQLHISDTINHIRAVANGVSFQAKYDQLIIDTLAGSNLPEKGALKGIGKDYASFKLNRMELSGFQFTGPGSKELKISSWTAPRVRLTVLRETGKKKNPAYPGLMASLFGKNRGRPFIDAVHIDSTHVKKLNFKFLYENGKKQVTIHDVGIDVNDIELDSTLAGSRPNYIFRDLRMDARGKSIISGDSMYAFRTRDIRVNLPLRRISFDSITVTPRFPRAAFFAKARKQTDRVTVYGKSIDFNDFDFSDLLKKKVFHVGSVNLNDFNVLFQRDKHYPLSDSAQPMPLALLREVPYRFDADSVLIKHGFVSYYEYEKKSTHPGIFFINNFNVYFLNVTNDFAALKPGAVLRIHGSGQMMRTSGLNFVLVMPYFSKDNRFWFSAQTGFTDLTRFNSLARNIAGISIVSGTGNVDVQYVTGNDKFSKGNMLFEYKNLKLRLYNRRKAKTNKGLGSPFVNFMLNNLMIRTNNPKFLKPPHKGIVYFERDPRKSFVNYLWKSCFSGITSTLGFNNRQQRIERKAEKKESKAEK